MSDAGEDKSTLVELLRGTSIALVLYAHYSNRVPPSALGATEEATIVFHAGKIGVYLFFVISGYLIALTMTSSSSLAEFYARRVSRIWPLFIAANVVIFAFLKVFSPPVVVGGPKRFYTEERTLIDLFGSIFFLEDLGFDWIDGVFWSILVELKFYLFAGLFAAFFRSNYVTAFSYAALVVGFSDFTLTLFFDGSLGRMLVKVGHGVLISQYAAFFAVGMCLYQGRRDGLFLALISLCLLQTMVAVGSNVDFNVGMTARFLVVLAAVLFFDETVFNGRVMLFLGRYSYSIYLFHQMIGLSVMSKVAPHIGIDGAMVIALGLTIGLSMLLSWAFEWRFRRVTFSLLLGVFQVLRLHRVSLSANGANYRPT